MNKRKLMLVAVALCMVAILGFGGTLAYLTDTDHAKNVFTVGNVDITLFESEVAENTENNGLLKYTDADGENKWTVQGNTYDNLMPGSSVVKDPTVTNVGDNDVYVRILVKYNNNAAIYNYVSEDMLLTTIVTGLNIDGAPEMDSAWKLEDGTYADDDDNIKASYENILGNDEHVLAFYVTERLAKDETFTLFEGFTVPTSFTATELEAVFGDLQIDITAHAIQADGFANVTEAFEAYDAQVK